MKTDVRESKDKSTRPRVANSLVPFIAVGGLAAVVNVGARWLMGFALPFEVAVVLAYVIGMITAFLLTRAFVFGPSGRSISSEGLRFVLVNVLALAQVWAVAVLLARWFFPLVGWSWNADLVAHTIGVISPVATSYYAHRFFTFAKSS